MELLSYLTVPKTVSQLQEMLKLAHPGEQVVNLETIRRDVRILKNNGQIKATGTTHGKEPFYVVSSTSALPVIRHEIINLYLQPQSFQKIYLEHLTTGKPIPGAMQAGATLSIVLNRILGYALYLRDNPRANLKQDFLHNQQELKKALRELYNDAKMIEQVLNQKTFWTESLLIQMTNDPEFNAEKVKRTIDDINIQLKRLQEAK